MLNDMMNVNTNPTMKPWITANDFSDVVLFYITKYRAVKNVREIQHIPLPIRNITLLPNLFIMILYLMFHEYPEANDENMLTTPSITVRTLIHVKFP